MIKDRAAEGSVDFDPQRQADGEYVDADFSGTRFRNVNFAGAKIMEAFLLNARISGMISGLTVNDVEIAPLIEAEMDRRYPERALLRAEDADGMRTAWALIERLWERTRARAEAAPEPLLHERVDGEWTFLETLRHLIFVADSWIGTRVLSRVGHYCRFGVLPSFLTDPTPFGIEVTADPPLQEVLAVREERLAMIRELVTGITNADLDRVAGTEHTVRECLRTVFEEEWEHNRYANRDLDALL